MSRRSETEILERLNSQDNLCNYFDSLTTNHVESPNSQGVGHAVGIESPSATMGGQDPTEENFDVTSSQDVPPVGETLQEDVDESRDSIAPEPGSPRAPIVIEKPMYPGGRRDGDDNLSDEMRKMIAAAANSGATIKEVAELYGVHPRTVANLKNAIVSPQKGVDADLKSFVSDTRTKVNKRALDKALLAVEAIQDEELVAAPLKLKAEVAKNLAIIAEKTADKETNEDKRVIIFVPMPREESHYQMKEAPIKTVN